MKFPALTSTLFLSLALVRGQIQSLPMKGGPPGVTDPNAPPAPPVTGKSTLSGIVVNGKTHEPIKKANVMINGTSSLSAVTDSGGNFSFRALPAGTYWIMANQAEFTQKQQRGQMALNVTLGDGEEKTGVEIALQPGATLSGKVINEDDQPVANCSVNASRAATRQSPQGFGGGYGGVTDSDGTYRIHGISPGRYTLRAQCSQSFPAPHGFMRLNDPEIPSEGYSPATYPGGGNTATSGLLVDAGADLAGIDFHVQRSRMFTVRASVSGVDTALLPTIQMFITSKDTQQDDEMGMLARAMGRRGTYVFRNVAAGNYEVSAILAQGDKAFHGRQDVQVGNSQVTDIEMKMIAAASLSGSVVTDDPNVQFEGQQLSLQPLQPNYRGAFPFSPISKDGSFELKAVLPGHFMLNGLQGGFFKSVTLGGREVNPSDFEITGEGTGVLHISLSSRFGKVHVSAESQPPQGEQISAVLIPVEGGQPQMNVSTVRPVDLEFDSVAPGKYRVLLLSSDNPGMIMNDPGIQKALEDRASQVTVGEASDQRVTASIVSREDLSKLLDSSE